MRTKTIKMRTKTIIILITLSVATFTLASCKEERSPLELSWTDYNSVTDVYMFFVADPSQYEVYEGSEIKICGYLFNSLETSNSWQYLSHRVITSNVMTDLFSEPYVTLYFFNPPSFEDTTIFYRKAYVTGTLKKDTYPPSSRPLPPIIYVKEVRYE